MEETDTELVVRYEAGHVDALELLVRKYQRPLFNYIFNMTGGGHDANDVFQEVWSRVIKKIGAYRDKNFAGWLIRIAHNIVVDRLRRKRQTSSLDEEKEGGQSLSQTVPSDAPSPGRQLEARDLAGRIVKAVAELPEDQREVFLMRVEADLSFKEIAETQGVSINTALARMQYALAKLRIALKDDYRELAG